MRLTTHYHHTRYEENGSEGKFSLRMPRRKSSVFKPPVLIQFQVTADMQEECVVRWWCLTMEVQHILSKTIDMCGEVWAQTGQDLFVHGIPCGRELVQDARLRMHVVEDQALGDEMAIFD